MKLVTGGTGFVGSYLLYRLAQWGSAVKALKRKESSSRQTELIFHEMAGHEGKDGGYAAELFSRVHWVHGDITDPSSMEEALEGVDTIFHSAAMVSFRPSEKPLMEDVNVGGTTLMVDLAIEKGIENFVHISSTASLPRQHNRKIDETFHEERPRFSSPYSETKYRSEMEVWRGRSEGLNVLVVNPSIIFGPCDFSRDEGSASFFNKVYQGIKFYPCGSNAFVDVRDVADKTLALHNLDEAWNKRYILTSEHWPFKEVFEVASSKLGVNPPTIEIGYRLGMLAARLDSFKAFITGKAPKITPALINTSVHNFYYDNTRVKELLNTSFIPVKDSIEDSCRLLLKMKNADFTYPELQKTQLA